MTNSQVETFPVGTCANPALDSRELGTWPYWSSLVMIVLHPEDRERTNETNKWGPWSSVDRARSPAPRADRPQHTALPVEDMRLFGVAPESDRLITATCLFCPAVRRLEFIAQHMLEAHPEESRRKVKTQNQDGTSESEDLPQSSETETAQGPPGVGSTSYIESPDLSESEAGPSNSASRLSNDATYSSDDPDSRGQPNDSAQLTDLDTTTTSDGNVDTLSYNGKKSSRKRRFSLEKNREYDPDEHCGVVTESNGKPCCYALSACKLHPVMQRRAVLGRRATYDELVVNCRRRVKEPSQHTRFAS